MAAANPDEITAKLVKLKLGESFLEKACDSVDEVFGPQWRDETKPRPYEWRAPSGSEKLGDEAEEMVMRALGRRQFCELLGEPVYIISGENFIFIFYKTIQVVSIASSNQKLRGAHQDGSSARMTSSL